MNLLRIHSATPYGYALTLLDTLFTREEQHQCLLFKSKKSEKPGLDTVRVEKLLGKFYCLLFSNYSLMWLFSLQLALTRNTMGLSGTWQHLSKKSIKSAETL